MACRECRYFDAEDDDYGFCRFPELAFPKWFARSLSDEHVETNYWMHANDGTDCPAFKAREGE